MMTQAVFGDAFFLDRAAAFFCGLFHGLGSVAHRDAVSDCLKHVDIVFSIPKSKRLFPKQSQLS